MSGFRSSFLVLLGSLLAFAIVAYCGVTLVRIGQRLRGMGGAGLARPGGRR